MKNRVIDKINNSYIYVVILAIYVVITLGISVSLTNSNHKDMHLVFNGHMLYLPNGIKDIVGTRYITREDIEENFSDRVFYDKISRTLIITTWDEKTKIKKGDEGTAEYETETVYSTKTLAEKLGYGYVEDSKTNKTHIYSYTEQNIKIKKNRVEVYGLNNKSVVGVVENNDKITLLETEAVYKDNKDKFLTVKVTKKDGETYLARIKKDSVEYVQKVKEVGMADEDRIVMTHVENKVASTTDLAKVTALSFEMLQLTSANKVEIKEYTLPTTKDIEIYAVIDNGYKSAGFDTNIITDLVHSDKNKEAVAMAIRDFVVKNKLAGIVIDFKKFKLSDKDLLEQYIKELAVLMHANNKKLIIKTQTLEAYDIKDIIDIVDYVIVQAYGTRTVASKTAGSHSTIAYVRELMKAIFDNKFNQRKFILEIPTYSILWTERGGTIINAEEYSMQAANEYLKENNIKPEYNEASGQNYVSYTKGIVTYKMWLEDELSIGKKMGMAYYQELAGICIYKSGEELKSVYSITIE